MVDRDQQADAIVAEAQRQLENVDASPFSPKAFHSLKLNVAAYVRSLITEAARIASRRRSDVISATHVQEASDYLVGNSAQRWFRHIGTVGGILLGASLSNFLAMTTASQYTATGVIASAVLAVIGAFGVALHIGRE